MMALLTAGTEMHLGGDCSAGGQVYMRKTESL